MLSDLLPNLFYVGGSICFLVGTLIAIAQKVR